MKQKFKNTKGITLVALIITIIILLILAVVAITSIKNNNIIEYAKNGRDNYIQKRGEEEEKINSYEQYIKDNIPNSGTSGEERIFYNFKNGIGKWKFKDGKWSVIGYNRDGTVESTQDVGFYKIKGDTITCCEDETFDEEYSTQLLIKDITIDGKTCTILTFADESDQSVLGFETMPPVRTDLEGKRYGYKKNENDETLTYDFTVRIYNIDGQKIMSFYDSEGSHYSEDEDYQRDDFVIFDGNKIYEVYTVKGSYGKINDDGTIDVDNKDESGNFIYNRHYVMDNN